MAITLISTREVQDGAKVRMRFSITGARKQSLATEALHGLAQERGLRVSDGKTLR